MKKTIIMIGFLVILTILFSNILWAQQMEQKVVMPKKVNRDVNFDGIVDRTEIYDSNGMIQSVESDSDSDGKIDEWITYKNGEPIKSHRDTNGDGKPDVWLEY